VPPFFLVADDQHTRERSESSPAAVHSIDNGRRACGEHFRVPTGALRAEVLCQASRSSLNGRMRSNAFHSRGRPQSDTVSSLHASMSGP